MHFKIASEHVRNYALLQNAGQTIQCTVPVICMTVNSEVTLQLLIDFCIILFCTMLIIILAVILTLRK